LLGLEMSRWIITSQLSIDVCHLARILQYPQWSQSTYHHASIASSTETTKLTRQSIISSRYQCQGDKDAEHLLEPSCGTIDLHGT
jgi:hypothetical protein